MGGDGGGGGGGTVLVTYRWPHSDFGSWCRLKRVIKKLQVNRPIRQKDGGKKGQREAEKQRRKLTGKRNLE